MNIKYYPAGEYKALGVPDLHKRDIDFTTIKGFRSATTQVQMDLLKYIKDNHINFFLQFGDWYDKGYHKIGNSKSDDNIDRAISNAVDGNAFICLGNHVFLERDENPEYYLIQPNDDYPTIEPFYGQSPIFQAVDTIMIGTVQIDFFHFSKLDKCYVHPRQPGATYRIGIYHDDCVVSTAVREAAGYYGHTTSDYLSMIYNDIDLALIGHIHTPIGIQNMTLNNGRTVPLVIPGSCGITKNAQHEIHKHVDIPLLQIHKDNTVTLSLVPFSTHIDDLRFYKKKEHKVGAQVTSSEECKSLLSQGLRYTGLRDYLEQHGHTSDTMKYLNLVNSGTVSIEQVITIFGEKQEDEVIQDEPAGIAE